MKARRPAKRALVAAGALLAGMILMPGHASASGLVAIGGGPLTGGVTFQQAIPLFPSFGGDSWSFSGHVTGLVLNTVPAGYIGDVTIGATGGSQFASLQAETGGVSATANGNAPVTPTQGSMSCTLGTPTTPAGGYARIATTVELTISGSCTVDGFTQNLTWVVAGEFTPDPTNPQNGNGITGQIWTADFVGAVQIYPGLP